MYKAIFHLLRLFYGPFRVVSWFMMAGGLVFGVIALHGQDHWTGAVSLMMFLVVWLARYYYDYALAWLESR